MSLTQKDKTNTLQQLKNFNIIKEGDFTLKSGVKSNIYVDLRQVMSFPELHKNICKLIIQKIDKHFNNFENFNKNDLLICGTPYGALSYSSFISITHDIPMIFIRKEAKLYGTKKTIEGNYRDKQQVILIEDVITTGGSVIKTAKQLESEGLIVSQIITIVSRCEAKQLLYNNHIPIEYLWHIDDILLQNTYHKNIVDIINEKNTKICLAADVESMEKLIELIHITGNHICVLKIHSDIISDFNTNFNENCIILNKLKQQYNFKIWEDRKLADIGTIMQKQINIIKKWADIVSIHPITGYESIEYIDGIEVIFIIELSTSNHLMNEQYTQKAIEIAHSYKNCVGIVSQKKMSDTLLHFVPGISLDQTQDNKGQQYNLPKDKIFADVFVIGRGIYNSPKMYETILKYKEICL